MTEYPQVEIVPRPAVDVAEQNEVSSTASTITRGASAAALFFALPLACLGPWGSAIDMLDRAAAFGVFSWFFFAIGIMVVRPVWDLLYRVGLRNWWHAALFGAVAGYVAPIFVMFCLFGNMPLINRLSAMAAIGSTAGAFVVWWSAYRPRVR